jgi:hypothetical protein
VVNDDLERCVAEIDDIVTAERARRPRRDDVVRGIVKTFAIAPAPVPDKTEEH